MHTHIYSILLIAHDHPMHTFVHKYILSLQRPPFYRCSTHVVHVCINTCNEDSGLCMGEEVGLEVTLWTRI
jgi:hypothetical protein